MNDSGLILRFLSRAGLPDLEAGPLMRSPRGRLKVCCPAFSP
jgi:hypothetical protein